MPSRIGCGSARGTAPSPSRLMCAAWQQSKIMTALSVFLVSPARSSDSSHDVMPRNSPSCGRKSVGQMSWPIAGTPGTPASGSGFTNFAPCPE
jgi:hypothetical protein